MRHLRKFRDRLEPRGDQGDHWWELRHCAYYDEFRKPKIIYPDIFQRQSFAYDPGDNLMINTLYFIPQPDVALLGILNSQLMDVYYARISNQIRGGYRRSFTQYISELPIVEPTNELRTKVKELLAAARRSGTQSDEVYRLESEIDEVVYKLYGLSKDEINILREQGSSLSTK
jgi:adenine-specific DNA-methyltransferase